MRKKKRRRKKEHSNYEAPGNVIIKSVDWHRDRKLDP